MDATEGTSMAAVQAAYNVAASAIVAITTTGRTAREASKYRPTCPIMAVTRFPQAARQMQLHRGILPLYFEQDPLTDWAKDVDLRIQYAIDFGKKNGFIKPGDNVICITGWRKGAGSSNTVRILAVD